MMVTRVVKIKIQSLKYVRDFLTLQLLGGQYVM